MKISNMPCAPCLHSYVQTKPYRHRSPGSNGKTSDTIPIITKNAQQTQIGTAVVTSPKVAMNGAERDAIRPQASVSPQPMPLYASGITSGVYLSYHVNIRLHVLFKSNSPINYAIQRIEPKVNHAGKGQILRLGLNGSEGAREGSGGAGCQRH